VGNVDVVMEDEACCTATGNVNMHNLCSCFIVLDLRCAPLHPYEAEDSAVSIAM